MSQLQQFFWLCKFAGEFVLFPPCLIAFTLLLINLVIACVKQRPFQKGLWRSSYWLVLTQMLFSPAVMMVAVLGGVDFVPQREASKVTPLIADVLFWVSVALAVFWIWRMKGLRWFSFSVVILEQFLLCGAFVAADMATSGRWI
jgi:hypothetical protein